MTIAAQPQTTTALINRYFNMWTEADPVARRSLVEAVFAPDGRHVDALADVNGYEALNDMVSTVHATYPGFVIRRTSAVDQYGQQIRYTWTLQGSDGTTIVTATDVGELSEDGRISRVAAFWGDPAPLEP